MPENSATFLILPHFNQTHNQNLTVSNATVFHVKLLIILINRGLRGQRFLNLFKFLI